MPRRCCISGPARAWTVTADSTPSTTPAPVTTAPSSTSSPITSRGPAPTARSTANSLRRSFRPARTVATSPARLTTATSADTSCRARSPRPTASHSSSRATPGSTPSSGSAGYSATKRWTLKTAARLFSPTKVAVTCLGSRSNLRASSAEMRKPGIGAPPTQSRCSASRACRLTCTVRSTGVPVRCRMPVTTKALSACSVPAAPLMPCASVMRSPRRWPSRCATSAPSTASYRPSSVPLKGRPASRAKDCRSP